MKVAIISINIGQYKCFWKEFFETCNEYFLPNCKKEYFVFTDAQHIEYEDSGFVHIYEHGDMGWPYNTMKRFHLFTSIEKELSMFDYVFFANANARFCYPLTKEFIMTDKDLVVVEHPGKHGDPTDTIPWERRKESRAYVSYEDGKIYVQGAFYGGKASAFLSMAKELDELTESDLQEGIIAVWHDESFLNMYIVGKNNVQILGWQYLKYEECIYPYIPVIELRDKRKYISNKNGRFKKENYVLIRLLQFLRNVKWWILIKLKVYRWYNVTDDFGNYVDLDISKV